MRTDSGVEQGSEVSAYYDSMLAKLIAHGPDRETALATLRTALAELRLLGPTTNAAYLRALLDHPDVRAGDLDTGLVERLGDQVAPAPAAPELAAVAAVALAGPPPSDDPWDARDGWRLGRPADLVMQLVGPAGPAEGRARPDGRGGWVDVTGRTVDVLPEGTTAVWLVDDGVPTRWEQHASSAAEHVSAGSLEAPMPGVILDVRTQAGATVEEGDVLVVMESMKMELSVVSPADGTVGGVHVDAGDQVSQGQPLVEVEAA